MKSKDAKQMQADIEAAVRARGVQSTDEITRKMRDVYAALGWIAQQLEAEEQHANR